MNFLKKKLLLSLVIIFLFNIFFFQNNQLVSAQNKTNVRQGLITSASKGGLTDKNGKLEADPYVLISKIVGYILSFIGIILLINLIFAGYQWMTSGGNDETIKKAKSKITSTIIGLIIIIGAYILTDLIFSSLDRMISQ